MFLFYRGIIFSVPASLFVFGGMYGEMNLDVVLYYG